jgi:hypothetical protein
MGTKGSMAGWIGYAGIVMLVVGFIDFFQGLIACSRTTTSSSPRRASSPSI